MPLGRQFDDSNLLTSSIKLIAEIKIQMNKSTSLTSMFPGYGPIEIYQGIRHGKLTNQHQLVFFVSGIQIACITNSSTVNIVLKKYTNKKDFEPPAVDTLDVSPA